VTYKSAIYSGLLLASAIGTGTAHAQFGGMMPPREAMALVRSMGFDPVGRPGFNAGRYVVRAVDPRGANVNVVVDAQLHRVVMVRPIPSSVALPPPGTLPPPGSTATLPPEDDGPGGLLGPRGEALTEDGIPAPRPPRGLPNQASARPLLLPQGPSVLPPEASAPANDTPHDVPTGSIPQAPPPAAKPASGSTAAPADRRPDIVIANHPPYIHTRPLPPTTTSAPPVGTAAAPQAAAPAPSGQAAPAPKPADRTAAASQGAAAQGAAPIAAAPKAATALPPITPLE
jgi:hypothetical protein